MHQREALEKKFHNRIAVTAKGGWSADATVMTETFGFDPAAVRDYRVLRGPGDTAAFTGSPRIGNRDFGFSLNTPQWKHVSLSAYYLWGATRTSSSGRRPTSSSPTSRRRCGPPSACA
jgi:hypothetical protein